MCSGENCHMLCLNKSVFSCIHPCVVRYHELRCRRLRCKTLGIINCTVNLKVLVTQTHTQARRMVFNAHSYFKQDANIGGPLYNVVK